jgi:hypothetical protein
LVAFFFCPLGFASLFFFFWARFPLTQASVFQAKDLCHSLGFDSAAHMFSRHGGSFSPGSLTFAAPGVTREDGKILMRTLAGHSAAAEREAAGIVGGAAVAHEYYEVGGPLGVDFISVAELEARLLCSDVHVPADRQKQELDAARQRYEVLSGTVCACAPNAPLGGYVMRDGNDVEGFQV